LSKTRILVTRVAYDIGKEVFEAAATEELSFECAPEEEIPLAAMVKETGAFGVVVAGTKYVGPLYEAVPEGGIIARYGVGHDGIDDKRVKARGIYLTNAPGALDASVAENAIFLMGAVAREIPAYSEAVKGGKWGVHLGFELSGETLSVIGFGRIGRKTAEIAAKGFGMPIVACDVFPAETCQEFMDKLSAEAGVGVRYTTSLREALSAGRFCSLHMPIMESTRGMIGRDELAAMPEGSYLINTARGAVVDEGALYDALASGHLAGAGLDAFTNEPYVPIDPEKDFRKLPNVVMTPHSSGSTGGAMRRVGRMCTENIKALLEGRLSDMTTY
jgi:phosphoglycerate dehydrogenase-like enzyme